MADVCSHQDESRRQVSATAHAVAYMRSVESQRYGENAWYNDPYAEKLGGQVALDYIEQRKASDKEIGKVRNGENLLNLISIRTRKIDGEVLQAINSDKYQQVCVIGAGLDTRAWRLQKTVDHSVAYFEVDFPEVFDWKLSVLKEAGAETSFDYHNITADLSLPGWTVKLVASGFDPTKPTVWLLEGFIGYLTEDEANAFMNALTDVLSVVGSRIIATLITTTGGNPLHRFFPPSALAWLNSHGWDGCETDIHDLGQQWGRPMSSEANVGNMVCVVEKKK